MPQIRILVVDDHRSIRETRALILRASGYEVITAPNGFEALLQMSSELPDLIISDLNMPVMSGFEFLSVVRRRFPQIKVIASSGAYHCGEDIPGGAIADAFFLKVGSRPEVLLEMIANVLAGSGDRVGEDKKATVPVWIPRNSRDSKGISFVVVTCTDCLRSFPVDVVDQDLHAAQETKCLFCDTTIDYFIDFSREASSPESAKSRTATGSSSASL